MNIVAIDLASNKSVACIYEKESGKHSFKTFKTTPQAIHDLMLETEPDQVIIEICPIAGWIYDLIKTMEINIVVANPTNEAWKWKNIKRKTDRDDALKLAQLAALNQLPMVYMPENSMRQWRALINYRSSVVSDLTSIKNAIRALLKTNQVKLPAGKNGWSAKSLDYLRTLSCSEIADKGQIWQYQLFCLLRNYDNTDTVLADITVQLDKLAQADERVEKVASINGVGNRAAEVIVAYIDQAKRFDNSKQVSCYAGLTPRQYESGDISRSGRISKKGSKLLRSMLVNVSWLALRYNKRAREIYNRIAGPGGKNKKRAIVAVARHILVWAWALMRDGKRWNELAEPKSAS